MKYIGIAMLAAPFVAFFIALAKFEGWRPGWWRPALAVFSAATGLYLWLRAAVYMIG